MELLRVCISPSFWVGHDVDPQRSKGLGAKVLGSVASVLRQ